MMCRCKLDSSNTKQMRGFLEDRELSSPLSQGPSQDLHDQREKWVAEVTSEVWGAR